MENRVETQTTVEDCWAIGRTSGTRLVSIAAALLALPVAGWAQGPEQPPSPVVASPVMEQEIRVGETFVGTVLPIKVATVGSAVAGRVIQMEVEEGDLVENGAPLANLLTSTIELERAAAIAELELRKQELAELKNGTRPEELAQAQARVKSAEAQRVYLEKRRDRAVELFRRGQAASLEEVDEAVSAADSAIQTLHEAQAAYELAVAGPRVEQIAQAEAQVRMQQAIVDRLSDQIAKHTIRARFRGYVTAEHTEVGAWVQSGEPVVDMVALDTVEIEAFVLEKHIPHVELNAEVSVEIPALSDRLFTGTVAAIVPQADVRARTFPVKVRVENTIDESGPLIKAGMFARVKLPTGQRQTAMLVSKDALVLGGAQPLVYALPASGTAANQQSASGPVQAVPVPVQLGVAWGDHIQVLGNLKPGQLTVVQGNERLRPMQSVAVTRIVKPELPQLTDAGSP